jgi:hypothetical protein
VSWHSEALRISALLLRWHWPEEEYLKILRVHRKILGVLNDLNHLDTESLGIYARTWMDRYTISDDINDLKQSRKLYAEAFEKTPDDSYTESMLQQKVY